MAIIAKAYNITHIDSLAIKVSSWNRPFDDLYDELNGRLDSANLSSNFSFLSSQITFNDSTNFFSATSLQNHVKEILPPGFHDIHFFAYGSKLCVFPGRAEVDGMLVRLKSRLNLDITSVSFTTGSLTTGQYVGVLINPQPIITATDILLVNITETNSIVLDGAAKTGLYDGTATSRKRALYSFLWMDHSQAFDHEFLTPPVTAHTYELTRSEALAHPVFGDGMETATGTSGAVCGVTTGIIRFFNLSTWRYNWELEGNTPNSDKYVMATNISNSLEDRFIHDKIWIRETNGNIGHKGNIATSGLLNTFVLSFTNTGIGFVSSSGLMISGSLIDVPIHTMFSDKVSKDKLTDG